MKKISLWSLVFFLMSAGAAMADPASSNPPVLQKDNKVGNIHPAQLSLPGIVVEQVDLRLHSKIERDFGAFLMEKLYDQEKSLLDRNDLLDPVESWAGK